MPASRERLDQIAPGDGERPRRGTLRARQHGMQRSAAHAVLVSTAYSAAWHNPRPLRVATGPGRRNPRHLGATTGAMQSARGRRPNQRGAPQSAPSGAATYASPAAGTATRATRQNSRSRRRRHRNRNRCGSARCGSARCGSARCGSARCDRISISAAMNAAAQLQPLGVPAVESGPAHAATNAARCNLALLPHCKRRGPVHSVLTASGTRHSVIAAAGHGGRSRRSGLLHPGRGPTLGGARASRRLLWTRSGLPAVAVPPSSDGLRRTRSPWTPSPPWSTAGGAASPAVPAPRRRAPLRGPRGTDEPAALRALDTPRSPDTPCAHPAPCAHPVPCEFTCPHAAGLRPTGRAVDLARRHGHGVAGRGW
jgi:hypothetical protein